MLLCVTASHKTADFELLERISVHTDDVEPLIAAHDECVRGAVVVATCNRFEAYLEMDEPVTGAGAVGVEAVLSALQTAMGVDADELEGAYEVVTGNAVAEHLFAVASGLESVVVGEGEIAGQVRRALSSARRRGTSSGELERLFQRASEAQRGVKRATALGRAGRSLVRLSLELADSRITDWATVRVLMIGTGSYAATTLAALRSQGAHDVTVYSPSGRAEAFAAKHGIAWTDTAGYPAVAAQSGLIITCTSVDHHVLDAALLHAGRQQIAQAALAGAETGAIPTITGTAMACPVDHATSRIVIDLGLPRNVDPDVTGVAGIELLDLETIRLHAPLEELQASDDARRIVDDAARRFAVVGEAQAAAPAVVALRRHVFGLVDAELERIRGILGNDRADPAVVERVEQAMRHLVGRLLHTPTVRAHDLAAQGRVEEFHDAIDAMFGLTPEAGNAASESRADGVA